jgi:hypothetical protein
VTIQYTAAVELSITAPIAEALAPSSDSLHTRSVRSPGGA